MNKKQENTKAQLSYPLIYLQIFLTLSMIVLAIITLFYKKILPWFELSLGVTLFDIALNNKLFYKRKGGTVLYIVIGIVLIGVSIMTLLGVKI